MNIHYIIIGLATAFAIVSYWKPALLQVSVLLVCVELFSHVSP